MGIVLGLGIGGLRLPIGRKVVQKFFYKFQGIFIIFGNIMTAPAVFHMIFCPADLRNIFPGQRGRGTRSPQPHAGSFGLGHDNKICQQGRVGLPRSAATAYDGNLRNDAGIVALEPEGVEVTLEALGRFMKPCPGGIYDAHNGYHCGRGQPGDIGNLNLVPLTAGTGKNTVIGGICTNSSSIDLSESAHNAVSRGRVFIHSHLFDLALAEYPMLHKGPFIKEKIYSRPSCEFSPFTLNAQQLLASHLENLGTLLFNFSKTHP